MFIFFISNILVGLTAFFLVRKFYKEFSSSDKVLAWAAIFMAQVVLTELSLGLAGRLYVRNLLFLNTVVLAVIFFLFKGENLRLKFSLNNLSFLFSNKILIFSLSVFTVFFIVKTWINLINPPICPDSYQYHLSFPAKWLIHGNLDNPLVIFGCKPTSAELSALAYYPINAELLFFWLMLPLRNAFFADIGQVPFYFLGIISIYSILRKFSVRRDICLFSGILWALIPNVFKQLRTGSQIDVLCAALVLLSLNFTLLCQSRLDFKKAILAGISFGMLIGTKLTNIFWLLSLAPLLIYILFEQRKDLRVKHLLLAVFGFFIFVFLLGSFSYIRTFIFTGNPFYPVNFEIFGKNVFPGFIDKDSFSRIFVNWEEFSLKNFLFSEGLGAQLFTFIIPGSFLPFLLLGFYRKKFDQPLKLFFLFLAPLVMLFMYFFVIKAFWVRYLFPYLGVGFICMVIFVSRFRWGIKYISFFGFISVVSSTAELAKRQELVISIIFAFILFGAVLFFRKKITNFLSKSIDLWKVTIFLGIVFFILFFLNEKYNREEFWRYPGLFVKAEAKQREIGIAWQWLNEHADKGKRIAYTGRSEFYPLFGERIKNDVFYISTNEKPPMAHFYRDGLYRKEKNFNSWLNNLKREGIQFLFVALPHEINNESNNALEFPIEDLWAKNNPELFRLVFSNSKARIYGVID